MVVINKSKHSPRNFSNPPKISPSFNSKHHNNNIPPQKQRPPPNFNFQQVVPKIKMNSKFSNNIPSRTSKSPRETSSSYTKH